MPKKDGDGQMKGGAPKGMPGKNEPESGITQDVKGHAKELNDKRTGGVGDYDKSKYKG
jgi:hypothetical protein